MGLCKMGLNIVGTIALAGVALVVIPGIPPDFKLEAFHIDSPKPAEGWFATNTILDEAELYYENGIGGLESVSVKDDQTIFTGDQTGNVLKVTNKQLATNVTRLQFPCSNSEANTFGKFGASQQCSWPLGMRFDNEGSLIVMDYFGGMTKVDLKTGSYNNIIPKGAPINNKVGHVPEDVDVAKDGRVYWTDGSTTGNFFVEMLTQPSGRLLRYDPATRRNEVLLEDLHFSNGVCLSDDEEYVIVAESGRSSIRRYYLRGARQGESDIFVSGLPGYPDNIRPNGRGGFYVGIAVPWNDEYSMRVHLLAPRPLLRKLILRSRHILLQLIDILKTIFVDNTYLAIIEKYVIENGPILNISHLPKTATVVELSKGGEIIGILNGRNGNLHSISQLTVGQQYAYLCSPFDSKIWRIKLETLRRMH